jgi:hypothetical protein
VNYAPRQQNPEKQLESTEVLNSVQPEKKIDTKGSTEVILSSAEVSSATSEVLGGIEDAESSEGGEGYSEDEHQGKAAQASGAGAATSTTATTTLPELTVMQKQVIAKIRHEIRKQEKEILAAYIGWKKIHPNKLAEKVQKLRSLKDLLSSVLDATLETLRGLYAKWVQN